jgi:hypothetical protein
VIKRLPFRRIIGHNFSTSGALTTVDLQEGVELRRKQTEYLGGLVSSCGTVLLDRRDVFSGRSFKVPHYRHFRCSDDAKIVIGLNPRDGSLIQAGRPPKVAVHGGRAIIQYDISPDGGYLAYLTTHEVCSGKMGTVAECMPVHEPLVHIAVSNRGEVAFDTIVTKGCDVHAPAGTIPANDYSGSEPTRCSAVGYWKPGLPTIRILAYQARNAWWITTQTASALVKWGTGPYPAQK